MSNISENKRIAKNSLFLFLRMLVTLVVGLYTSRVILAALGVSDFGVYNVIGGIVTMFVFINTAMINSTQRFITYELGKNENEKLNVVFSTSLNIHIIISLIIVLLSETIGLWFLYNKMVIPPERLDAALWVFQFSVFSSVATIMSAPYNALIIAHEKMSTFAYISLFDALLKLIIAYVLLIYNGDRLILYGLLIFILTILERLIYGFYCKQHFEEAKYKYCRDKVLAIEMTKFATWNLFGNFSYTCYTQGLNLLLNVFFTPAVNAARGLAVQVQTAVTNFSYNVDNAIKPQITKAYAQHDISRMHGLINISARISFFILLIVSLPILLETDLILNLWLKEVPEHTSSFVKFTILILWVEAMANPLQTAAQATGDIKKYQLMVSLLCFSILPLSYIFLLIYSHPIIVYIVSLILETIVQFVKLLIVGRQIGLSIRDYILNVFARSFLVAALSFIVVYACNYYLQEGLLRLGLEIIASIITCSLLIILIGVKKSERIYIKSWIRFRINKIKMAKYMRRD